MLRASSGDAVYAEIHPSGAKRARDREGNRSLAGEMYSGIADGKLEELMMFKRLAWPRDKEGEREGG